MNTETAVRKNFVRSSGIVAFAFFLTAGLNILLLGWLARQGGLALVGVWSFLNTIMMFILIADFGYMNAFTRAVSMQGVNASLPMILWLCLRLIALSLAVLPVVAALTFILPQYAAILTGVGLAAAAGTFQLISNWLVSLRLGQHQQFWFNVKTIVRVCTQTGLAVVFYQQMPGQPVVAFGAAMFLGGLAEALFTMVLLRRFAPEFHNRHSHPTNTAAVWALSKGFGISNLVQRAQLPLWNSLVLLFGGATALAGFTIALRIPTVLMSAVSEALRGLLPGLSQLQQKGEAQAVLRILRDGVLVQLLLTVPACLFFMIYAGDVLSLWLGTVNDTLLATTRILTLAIMIGSLGVPYFWALQAFGDARKIAWATALNLSIVMFAGGAALAGTDGSLPGFAGFFLIASLCSTCLILFWSEKSWGVTCASISQIYLTRVLLVLMVFTGVAWGIRNLLTGLPGVFGLSISAMVVGVFYLGALVILHKRQFFQKCKASKTERPLPIEGDADAAG